ncbi:MAG: DUF983 domain-containing protein, partial [Rhodomicrobium sp.]|nr:DUF983 domain-containing protein [Rhodomicrobium sp.]
MAELEYSPQQPAETVWTNAGAAAQADHRPVLPAVLRGLRRCCPQCGSKTLFSSYLSVSDDCAACGEELKHHRADDAPPYFTIVIVGHIVVSSLMTVELAYGPPLWLHLLIWLPLTVILSLLLLPRIKGGIVGLQ